MAKRQTSDKEKSSGEIAGGPVGLILTGDGARSAYEAGALSVLLPLLHGEDAPRIILGTSAGALNAALIAAVIDQGLDVAAEKLLQAWRTIRPEKVFAPPFASTISLMKWHLRHAPANGSWPSRYETADEDDRGDAPATRFRPGR